MGPFPFQAVPTVEPFAIVAMLVLGVALATIWSMVDDLERCVRRRGPRSGAVDDR